MPKILIKIKQLQTMETSCVRQAVTLRVYKQKTISCYSLERFRKSDFGSSFAFLSSSEGSPFGFFKCWHIFVKKNATIPQTQQYA